MSKTNFGRNLTLSPTHQFTPKNERELLELLNRFPDQSFRVVGRMHSWSRVLEADDVLLDLRQFDFVQPEQQGQSYSVRVGAGCQIKRLLSELQRQRGWTLPSVGFITEQTVAGAIATGTHGSGRHSLSHYVQSVRVARFDPSSGRAFIEEIDSGDRLRAARCSLGCLGIITSVQMQCRPAYRVEEQFRSYDHLEEVIEAESQWPLQQFYLVPWRWTLMAQHRRETESANSSLRHVYWWYRFLVFDLLMHFAILAMAKWFDLRGLVRWMYRAVIPNLVVQNWSVVGPAAKQLVMEHELFRHVEIEIFVRQDRLQPAVEFLKETLVAAGAPGNRSTTVAGDTPARAGTLHEIEGQYCHHYPICIRKVLADDTLISMASDTAPREVPADDRVGPSPAWYAITLTNYQRHGRRIGFERVASYLAKEMARRFDARPHWGKLCPLPMKECQRLYKQLQAFGDICRSMDPQGRFQNRWTTLLLSTDSRATDESGHSPGRE
ncbi:FAD-binding protein [Roseiconus nitratireducens]|uniref:FAD-binding protein n=1 Tax=Roseiconus nitratireducens TaxID=2605748 RepID=A0A5M6DD54_9BACT|nr:D-arabinono-1,4-lactone oxidase [Roseiconus nitratireducens]KAA5545448.1 FAD-binding protein [Roseiconus nitratireducens]